MWLSLLLGLLLLLLHWHLGRRLVLLGNIAWEALSECRHPIWGSSSALCASPLAVGKSS
jgi:hypothetical protein